MTCYTICCSLIMQKGFSFKTDYIILPTWIKRVHVVKQSKIIECSKAIAAEAWQLGLTSKHLPHSCNIRWPSTGNYTELTRLSTSTDSASHNFNPKEKSSSTSPSSLDQVTKEITNEKIHRSVKSKTPSTALESVTQDTKLPPIPSFSEFINSKRAKGSQLSTSENHSPKSMHNNREKRTRFQ